MREGKAKVPTPAEFARLLKVTALERHGLRNVAILMVSFGLGLRVGEISRLRVSDILNGDGELRDHFQITKKSAKNNRNRDIYLSSRKVCQALREYLCDRQQQEGIQFSLRAPLFLSQKGGSFTSTTLATAIKSMYRRAGLAEECKSHSGRRAFATSLISQGVDLKSVATLMGHSNVNLTATYADTNPDVLKKVAARAV